MRESAGVNTFCHFDYIELFYFTRNVTLTNWPVRVQNTCDTNRCSMDFSKLQVIPGRPYPMGIAVYEQGVRFTVFSRHATRVFLALFNHIEDLEPAWEYEFDADNHRVGDVWSIFVKDLHPDFCFYPVAASVMFY